MDIECKDCHKKLGTIITGSKIHKQIIYLCTNCYDRYNTYRSLADTKYGCSSNGSGPSSMPPGFEDLFRGTK